VGINICLVSTLYISLDLHLLQKQIHYCNGDSFSLLVHCVVTISRNVWNRWCRF